MATLSDFELQKCGPGWQIMVAGRQYGWDSHRDMSVSLRPNFFFTQRGALRFITRKVNRAVHRIPIRASLDAMRIPTTDLRGIET